jgi:hypothetical protein
MSLFGATGFNLPEGPPVSEASPATSKNRKRPRSTTEAEPENTVIDVEKLLKRFTAAQRRDAKGAAKGRDKKNNKAVDRKSTDAGKEEGRDWKKKGQAGQGQVAAASSSAASARPPIAGSQARQDRPDYKAKRPRSDSHGQSRPEGEYVNGKAEKKKNQKRKQGADGEEQSIVTAPTKTLDSSAKREEQGSGVTELQKKMRSKLQGSRFRWINEQLVSVSISILHNLLYLSDTDKRLLLTKK